MGRQMQSRSDPARSGRTCHKRNHARERRHVQNQAHAEVLAPPVSAWLRRVAVVGSGRHAMSDNLGSAALELGRRMRTSILWHGTEATTSHAAQARSRAGAMLGLTAAPLHNGGSGAETKARGASLEG